MTVTITIDIQDGSNQATHTVVASDAALADVRFAFNPSGLQNVAFLKALAAAFITEAQAITNPDAGREIAVARTEMQTASMWAVGGATKGL